jgi:hypothetical protein
MEVIMGRLMSFVILLFVITGCGTPVAKLMSDASVKLMGSEPGKDHFLAPDYRKREPKKIGILPTELIDEDMDLSQHEVIPNLIKRIEKYGYETVPIQESPSVKPKDIAQKLGVDAILKTKFILVDTGKSKGTIEYKPTLSRKGGRYEYSSKNALVVTMHSELIDGRTGDLLWRDTFTRELMGTGTAEATIKALFDPWRAWGMHYDPLAYFPAHSKVTILNPKYW